MYREFDNWLEIEHEKERQRVCKQFLDKDCFECPYEEECRNYELLNSLEEW